MGARTPLRAAGPRLKRKVMGSSSEQPGTKVGRAEARGPTRRLSSRLLSLALLAFSTVPVVAPTRADAAGSDTSVACVEAWGQARYGNAGYDHIVHVKNGCQKSVLCRVWTNVNPDPAEITVPSEEEREVLTFRGSLAREFVPHVECRLLL